MERLPLFLSLVAVSSLVLAAPPVERKLYVGKDSTEARMSFRYSVHFEADKVPTEEEATEKIEAQIMHLFGPMGEARVKAVPTGDHKITNVKVENEGNGEYAASYTYEGTIVLGNGPTTTYDVVLPINPDTIYDAGIVTRQRRKSYPCTDSHYNSEGDFWYFWNPAKRGCPLKKGTDYDVVKTQIKRIPNTKVTYPEYNRLAHDGVIRIDVLMGMDDQKHGRNPLQSTDENAKNYRQIRQSLVRMGYSQRQWTAVEIKEVVAGGPDGKLPFVEEFTKKQPKAEIQVRMFFGPSGIDEESKSFHYFFKDALEHAAVMVYDGHSGLGGHLDLEEIEKQHEFRFGITGERYQIYFFNSCSSYTYYNKMYFKRKKTPQDPKGTKQLDILTNGLATYFYVMHNTNLALVQAIDAWAEDKAIVSYQAIAKTIDSGNLFGVNGDEDNPTTPNEVR